MNTNRVSAGSNPMTTNRVTARSNRDRVQRVIAGAAVAALLFSACAADDDQSLGADGQVAAIGVLPTVSGGQIDTNSLEGTDTILWFWAPW
ncbi:MAG: hypothetical protein OES24_02145 [Acidimicrobiia bacterium]|nr:hypothetical protein [Acidimicrobiia bacterium]